MISPWTARTRREPSIAKRGNAVARRRESSKFGMPVRVASIGQREGEGQTASFDRLLISYDSVRPTTRHCPSLVVRRSTRNALGGIEFLRLSLRGGSQSHLADTVHDRLSEFRP